MLQSNIVQVRLRPRRAHDRLPRMIAEGFEADSPLAAFVRPSPNHGARRAGMAPDAIVLHYTGMPTAEGALDRLCAADAQVSCHYFVFEDGRIAQLVPEARRAWHAGASFWAGESDMNSASIGIEIVNPGHEGGAPPFPPAQVAAVARLCRDIMRRHAIGPARVLAHSDISPGRKVDPGEIFPWEVLAAAGVCLADPAPPARDGLTLAPGATGAPVAALRAALARFGYRCEPGAVYDARTATVVAAFQRRFRRARVDGVADVETRDRLAALNATVA